MPAGLNTSLLTKNLHTVVGLGSALFVAALAVTGVALSHPGVFIKGAAAEVLSVAADPANPSRLYRGTRGALERSEDGGATWAEVPMLFPAAEVVSIAFDPRAAATVYVLQRWQGLLKSEDGGEVWEEVPLSFDAQAADVELTAVAAAPDGSVLLETSAGMLKRTAAGEWKPIDFDVNRKNWPRLVKSLHNGHFFGPWFVKIYDAAAFGLLALIGTGLILWRIKKT